MCDKCRLLTVNDPFDVETLAIVLELNGAMLGIPDEVCEAVSRVFRISHNAMDLPPGLRLAASREGMFERRDN